MVSRKDKHVELVEDVGDTSLTCLVDWFAVGQVFRNIFENAIDASPNRGVVTVTCAMVELDEVTAIEISIQDNGSGVALEVRTSLFDAFFTTKPKGTGLGARFIIRLPRD